MKARRSLQLVHIYIDTATYDDIYKDVRTSLEAMLGVIWATLGIARIARIARHCTALNCIAEYCTEVHCSAPNCTALQ